MFVRSLGAIRKVAVAPPTMTIFPRKFTLQVTQSLEPFAQHLTNNYAGYMVLITGGSVLAAGIIALHRETMLSMKELRMELSKEMKESRMETSMEIKELRMETKQRFDKLEMQIKEGNDKVNSRVDSVLLRSLDSQRVLSKPLGE